MMLLDLGCYECIMEQINSGTGEINEGQSIPTPFEQVNNTGLYEVTCNKGHKSYTIIDNMDFEILFEYGINAIADGYYRESVSSLTASMERYFEFAIKTILRNSNVDFAIIDKTWKNIANQSERQLGAYIALYTQAFGEEPILLNSNKDVPFRNSVIHKGYIPTKEQAIEFGNAILKMIETSLITLKSKFPQATIETFDNYGFQKTAYKELQKIEKETKIEKGSLCVNIMTTIDVKHGRELNNEDGRKGNIEERIPSILERREPRSLRMFKDLPDEYKNKI
ncbi:MAG: hypothetical protein V4565_05075 [Bacteroidota bacterium]